MSIRGMRVNSDFLSYRKRIEESLDMRIYPIIIVMMLLAVLYLLMLMKILVDCVRYPAAMLRGNFRTKSRFRFIFRSRLLKLASRVLKEGGSLVMSAGYYALPEIFDYMKNSGLKYWWAIVVVKNN